MNKLPQSSYVEKNQNKVFIILAVLSMLFIAAIIISDILTYKVVTIFDWSTSLALFSYPLSYAIMDVVSECFGRSVAVAIIIAGLVIELMADCSLAFSTTIVSKFDVHYQHAFAIALSGLGKVALGSIIAALLGYLVNTIIMLYLKKRYQGKYFQMRSIISTLVGEAVFIVLAYTIWFWGTGIGEQKIIQMIMFSFVFKILFAIVYSFIGAELSKKVKSYMSKDLFDRDESINLISV